MDFGLKIIVYYFYFIFFKTRVLSQFKNRIYVILHSSLSNRVTSDLRRL
jgi:hypothetical protein